MISKRMGLLACVVIILLVLSPSALFSQMAGTGQIDGTVTDKSGGAIAGATAFGTICFFKRGTRDLQPDHK